VQSVYFPGQAEEFSAVRGLQPQIIIDNRLEMSTQAEWLHQGRLRENEDYYTPEQRVGGYDEQTPWERCMTLGTQWSWKPGDKIKSASEIISILARTVGGDGNLLLNAGPMPDGRIEPRQVTVLNQVGVWMRQNGESIYRTLGGPWKPTDSLASTREGKAIYVHIMKWPAGAVKLPNIPAKILGARLLGGGKAAVRQTDRAVDIFVSPTDRNPMDTVVALRLDSDAGNIPAVSVPAETAQP
jgi:alpha-L-fucosidase